MSALKWGAFSIARLARVFLCAADVRFTGVLDALPQFILAGAGFRRVREYVLGAEFLFQCLQRRRQLISNAIGLGRHHKERAFISLEPLNHLPVRLLWRYIGIHKAQAERQRTALDSSTAR